MRSVIVIINKRIYDDHQKAGQLASRRRWWRDAGHKGQKSGRPAKSGTGGNPINITGTDDFVQQVLNTVHVPSLVTQNRTPVVRGANLPCPYAKKNST